MPELEIIANSADYDSADLKTPGVPLPEPLVIESVSDEQVWEHCRKVIQAMMKRPAKESQRSVSMLLGREREDPNLGLPPEALYDMLPVLFNDPLKAMKFLRTYAILHDSPFAYNVSTGMDDTVKAAGYFPPIAIIAYKLYERADWFKNLPENQRLARMLQKGVVVKTLPEVIKPLIAKAEEHESRIIVYGPRADAKYNRPGDSLRAAMIEEKIFKAVREQYGKNPLIVLRRDKGIRESVGLLKEMFCR